MSPLGRHCLRQERPTDLEAVHDLAARVQVGGGVNPIAPDGLGGGDAAVGVEVAAAISVVDLAVYLVEAEGVHEAGWGREYWRLFWCMPVSLT